MGFVRSVCLGAVVMAVGCQGCDTTTTLDETIPLLTASSTEMDFGDVFVGAPKVRMLTLQSTGTGLVHVRGAALDGDAAFSTSPVAASGLAPGATLRILVTFQPVLEGLATGTLTFDNDSKNAAPLVVALRGNARGAPSCEDGNACTDDAFNPVDGMCVHINNTNPCDSGSLCTTQDRCVNGECLGLPTECDDNNPCTRNLCDARVGCVYVPESCEDFNTCTLDSCDASRGCQHSTLPDGAPCEDGNLCSLGDQCAAGVCVGNPSNQQAIPVARLFGYGSNGVSMGMEDGRVVFFDSLEAPVGQLQRVSVVTRAGNVFTHQASTDFPGLGALAYPQPLPDGSIAAVGADAGGVRVHIFSVAPDGAVTRVGWTPPINESLEDTVSFGNVVYALARGSSSSALIIVNAADPAAPTITQMDLGAFALDIAVDPLRPALLVAAAGGVVRFALADPLVPVALDTQLQGTLIYQVATNGVVTTVLRNSALGPYFADAVTGVGLASVTLPGTVPSGQLAQRGDLVFVATGDRLLHVFSVAGGATTATPLASTQVPINAGQALVVGGAPTVVSMGPRAYVFDAGVPGLLRVTGPGHGALGRLYEEGALTLTMSHEGAHRMDLTQPEQPQFVSGAQFPEAAEMVSFSSQLRTPTLLVSPNSGPSTNVFDAGHLPGLLRWMDASDLDHPVMLGTAALPMTLGIHRFLHTDGRRMYMVNAGISTRAMHLGIINTDDGPGMGDTQLDFFAELEVPPLLARLPYPWPAFIAKDKTAPRLAMSVREDNVAGPLSQIAVVDLGDPSHPSVLVTFVVPFRVDGLALAGNLLAAVERRTGAEEENAAHVFRWNVPAGSEPAELASFDVEGLTHFLLMDETVLLMSTRSGVAYANLLANPPALMGAVDTTERFPISALVHDQNLLLGFPGEVMVVSPPCPPPVVP